MTTEGQKEHGTCRRPDAIPGLIAVWPLAIGRRSKCKPRRSATQVVFLGRAVGVLFLVIFLIIFNRINGYTKTTTPSAGLSGFSPSAICSTDHVLRDVLSWKNPRPRQYANTRFCFLDEGFQFFVFVASTTDIPFQDLH